MKTQSLKSKTHSLPEELLIDLALAGNQRAYTIIFERHERMLSQVIGRYLDKPEDIEECLQDTLVRMYRALPKFRRECKLSSWLYQIATFTAINYFRSKTHRYHFDPVEAIPETAVQSPQPEAITQLERRDLRHWINNALNLLQDKDAEVLRQFYLMERSIDEICQCTGLTESNIKTRLSRARIRLREVVEQQFPAQLLN